MNWDEIEGKWKTYKGKVRERWGELNKEDLDIIAGKREQLVEQLQSKYGIAREEAELEISDFLSKVAGDETWHAKNKDERKAG
jgi:uncharacterized protein YjbJ (UPF0337 family)